ncbi:phosphoenolpyruvate synthase [Anaeroselena agilis]|uniref:Phosphoenolpyruvate synthase n=1 Tax=Anaeroselena agilis TaxID=3063788 RepID=A0ABU3NTZ4_9FIRM|nr:phosphoenolpyruvate synthase [Selenomonadales bacterium 4137-cl]
MTRYVLFFAEINRSSLPAVGGKGANLAELWHIPGIAVPEGFCVTTDAYADFVGTSLIFKDLIDLLDVVDMDPLTELKQAGERIRSHLEALAMPVPIEQAIVKAWRKTGPEHRYAIRSSATAEDLPDASFAGQQDTYLNVAGEKDILDSVRKCWASLFTDRAIAYRRRNGFDHGKVRLSVIVQRMVFPEVAGIMFTADPITGNRAVVSIDASFGLGEALVSGIVTADLYKVRDDKVIVKNTACKEVAIRAASGGGTEKAAITGDKRIEQCLTDENAIRLARMGRNIEEHFGGPQDIEWCLVNNDIFIVQSRPITTLYPVPPVADDRLHLFLSLGHPQMMTAAIKPLGISVLRTMVPFRKASPNGESGLLLEAGSRLYFDITPLLAYREVREKLPALLRNVDEAIGQAVAEFIGRDDFRLNAPPDKKLPVALAGTVIPTAFAILRNILYRDNDHVIDDLNRYIANRVNENRNRLQAVSGPARIAMIQEILSSLLPTIFPRLAPYIVPALVTYKLIGHLARKWLGDTAELCDISKAPPGNVTSEMGLALGDVADAAREHPAVIEYFQQANDATFLDGLRSVPGGEKVLPALVNFFARYGMRCTGEIDLTRPRWRESPTQLVPALLSHIAGMAPGQHRRDFAAGQQEADAAAERLLSRLSQTSGGMFRAKRMRRLIHVHRSLIGIREHPKYFVVQHLDLVKQALMLEAASLVAEGILEDPEEIYWLSLPEIARVLETGRLDRTILAERRDKYARDAKLTPPRAMTGEGEIIIAKPSADAPPGALTGSAVSAGVAEGRARVILRLEEAQMDKGDILVAPFTDPGWTPLFPLAAGIVTEVGGLMTHGAVVAREYGIPAVAGVDGATIKIKDGQQIRIDGTRGFVQLLDGGNENKKPR